MSHEEENYNVNVETWELLNDDYEQQQYNKANLQLPNNFRHWCLKLVPMNPTTGVYEHIQFWIELQTSWNGSCLENHIGYLMNVNKPKWNIFGVTIPLKAPYNKFGAAVKKAKSFAEDYVKRNPIANNSINSHSFVNDLREVLGAPRHLP